MTEPDTDFREAIFALILLVSERLLAGQTPSQVRAELLADDVAPEIIDKVFDEVRPNLVQAFEKRSASLRGWSLLGGFSGLILWFLGQSESVPGWLAGMGLAGVGLAVVLFLRGTRDHQQAIRLNSLDWSD
ncbi:MAG: hypothetical protein CMH55_03560 [Myxococcales bacterium]|nr:hypothetical protein [Myxococcales bacterium]